MEAFGLDTKLYQIQKTSNLSLDLALEALTLGENIKNDVMVGYSLHIIGFIYALNGEHDTALESAMKGLKYFESLAFQVGIAFILSCIGIDC